MKLIIDIPDNIYEWVMNTGKFGNYRFDTAKAIKNGTPLDDVKAEILQLDYDLESIDFDYNDMALTEEIHTICREEVLQILDNIGKGEKE